MKTIMFELINISVELSRPTSEAVGEFEISQCLPFNKKVL